MRSFGTLQLMMFGVGAVDRRHGDALVVGSSPGGVLSRVFLGSHATRIVRQSPVPVVVVPA